MVFCLVFDSALFSWLLTNPLADVGIKAFVDDGDPNPPQYKLKIRIGGEAGRLDLNAEAVRLGGPNGHLTITLALPGAPARWVF